MGSQILFPRNVFSEIVLVLGMSKKGSCLVLKPIGNFQKSPLRSINLQVLHRILGVSRAFAIIAIVMIFF